MPIVRFSAPEHSGLRMPLALATQADPFQPALHMARHAISPERVGGGRHIDLTTYSVAHRLPIRFILQTIATEPPESAIVHVIPERPDIQPAGMIHIPGEQSHFALAVPADPTGLELRVFGMVALFDERQLFSLSSIAAADRN